MTSSRAAARRPHHRAAALGWLVLAGAVAVAVTVVTPELAVAAGNGEDIGRNFGQWLLGQVVWVWLAVGAAVSIAYLANQRKSELIQFLAVFAVIGMFVVAPVALRDNLKDIYEAILG